MATQNPVDNLASPVDRSSDAVPPDAQPRDPAPSDAAPSDAAPSDAAPSDATLPDAGRPEAGSAQPGTPAGVAAVATSLVVCSLESWTEVRRRIRILVDELVDLDPSLQVLFVAPSVDVLHELRQGKFAEVIGPRGGAHGGAGLEQVHPRIHVLRPRKWLPRVVGPFADRSLERQILEAVKELGLPHPLLWINDASYAGLALRTGWPTLYDITDDWLLAPMAPRQRQRLEGNERSLIEHSQAVVVCSPDLARTRGESRPVELIPNGVDLDLFGAVRPRPPDLPPAPVALYVGTLHTWRTDIELLLDLARARPDVQVALVGPNSLPHEVTEQLEGVANIHVLGARPYDQIPAYMQHADIIVIPHLVNPFTESLDPIKAYECLAVGRPTVTTPVAGFRELGAPIVVADRGTFVSAASSALAQADPPGGPTPPVDETIPTWHDRAEAMASVMVKVRNAGGSQ
jgi:teichuronic acid biosynthesis glycosyltransferase TuaH